MRTHVISCAVAAAALLSAGLTSTAHASMLVGWDLLNATAASGTTNDGTANDVSPTTIAGGISSTVLSRGAGFVVPGPIGFTGRGNMGTDSGSGPATLAAAVTANFYVQFTVTPSGPMSLSSLDLAAYQQNLHNPDLSTVAVEYDSGAGYTLAGSATGISDGWTGNAHTVDLSGIADLQNVAAPVAFRLYFYGFGAYEVRGLGQVPGSNTDLGLNGSAGAVPEPASLGLLGLGALALLRRRR